MASLPPLLRQVLPRSLVTSWKCRPSTELLHQRHIHQIQKLYPCLFATSTYNSPALYTSEHSRFNNPILSHHWTQASPSTSCHACGLPKSPLHCQLGKVSCRYAHTDAATSVSFELKGDHVVASWREKTFHCSYFWLRDHCQCPDCFDVNTYQHLVETNAVDPAIVPQTLDCTEEGIQIIWPDNHQTFYSWDWLNENGPGQHLVGRNRKTTEKVLWDGATLERVLPQGVRFDDLVSSDKARKTVLETLFTYGIAFVDEVPLTQDDTQRAVESIAPVLETFYGKMWTFTADLAMADSAFTNATLNTHHDTTYFYEPAGLQVLHCLHHDGTGGENPMVDGFRAAEALRRKHPQHFDTLCRIPVVGRYLDDSRNISTPYYTIAMNPITQEMDHVRFNAYDRGPLSHLSEEDMTAYYAAFRALAEEIQNPSSVYQIKLIPGRMMVFDNWRVLHGRKGFTGKRIMSGCYASRLDYLNKLRTVGGIRV